MPIRCEIVSQDRMVFEGDADIVVLPGRGWRDGHPAPSRPVADHPEDAASSRCAPQGQEEIFTVAGGVAEVQPDIVTILADAAENVEEIDVARAEAARKRAEEILAKGVPADSDAYLKMEAALRKSNLRLDAVKRYRRGARKPARAD